MTADTTPPGDTTTAREALVLALDPLMPTVWAQDIADDLLAGPLSDPAVVAQLDGAAGLVRELGETRERLGKYQAQLERAGTELDELGAVALAVALALEETRAKLAQVEKYAGVLADTGPRTYAGSEIARALRNAIGATP